MSEAENAQRACQLATKAFHDGDFERALNLVQKSIRINPTDEAQALLIQINNRKRKMSGDKPVTKDDVNSEDYKLCCEILLKKDYYDLLSVAKTATEEEIKSKYKRLALKLHPDKNHCSKATEAFKKVASAYNCLTNKEKRAMYDIHGNEEQFQQTYERGGDEEDMSPDDLFNFLFFGAMPNRRGRPRREYQMPQPRRQSKIMALVQFLPFIIMIIAVMAMNFRGSNSGYENYFSFQRNYLYPLQMSTHGITFYVSNDFQILDPYDKARVVKTVEATYTANARQSCLKVKSYMKALRSRIESSVDGAVKNEYISQYERLEQNDYQVCKEYERLCDMGLCF